MNEGFVKTVNHRGFGFIAIAGDADAYFHVSDISDPDLPFDDTLYQRRVRFDLVEGPRGLRAKNVRAVE
jgi:cold shock CspA family protein